MPSGENWQNDVLRDLRGGAAPQQPAPGQPSAQQPAPGQPPAQQPAPGQPPAQQPAPAQPPAQQPAPGQPPAQQPAPAQPPAQQPAPGQPSAQQPAAQQGTPAPHQAPRPDAPARTPQAQGSPAQDPQPQGVPAQDPQPQGVPAQPSQAPAPPAPSAPARTPASGSPQPAPPYGHPQQPHADQAAQHPGQPTAPHPAPQGTPHPAHRATPHPTPQGNPRRTTPDSRPVVDKRLAAVGLKPRRGEPFAARALRAVRRTVSSSAAREVAETTATAEVLQRPVTTGRQIAVTSIRGGSGKTTVAALLGTAYAHYRQDPVLIVEADPALGSLPLRLGAESLRWTTGDLATFVEPQMSLLDVTGYLVQLPENAWLLPGSQGQVGAMLDTKGYERVMVSLRRYFGVTVVDCETLPAEVARTALSAAQARVLTVNATLEGIASTRSVLEWMRGLPRDITTSTVVALTETAPHPGLDLDKAAEQLRSTGASVRVLPYDRHLAAGGAIRTDLLARATRQAVTRLAAEVFELSQKRR
ncbi:MinD/ParA family ATP-binding protein [Streptomyces canus]|uniref:MinD/ParA family ATP-binding protein n=1 Tax=Streptomyces canus TaxID=58343 RepID=UPI003CF7AB0A